MSTRTIKAERYYIKRAFPNTAHQEGVNNTVWWWRNADHEDLVTARLAETFGFARTQLHGIENHFAGAFRSLQGSIQWVDVWENFTDFDNMKEGEKSE